MRARSHSGRLVRIGDLVVANTTHGQLWGRVMFLIPRGLDEIESWTAVLHVYAQAHSPWWEREHMRADSLHYPFETPGYVPPDEVTVEHTAWQLTGEDLCRNL